MCLFIISLALLVYLICPEKPLYVQLNPGGVLSVATSTIPCKKFQPFLTRQRSHRHCLLMRAKASVETDMLAKDSVGANAVDDKGDPSLPS